MVKKSFSVFYLILVLMFLYLPILFIIVFSFSGNNNFVFNGFTFDSYIEIFTSEKSAGLMSALINTLIIASAASVISTIHGAFAAVGIFYMGKRSQKIVMGVNQLPVINSEVVMAVALLILFNTLGFPTDKTGGFIRLIIGHISFCTPYVVLSVMPKLNQMDPNIYEAALDLGATPMQAMRKVILPTVMPGVVSGFVMAFTLSMDDFIITQMNKGTSGVETLSTYIYGDARVGGLEPFWFAVFSIIFVVVLTIVLAVNLKNSKERKAA